MTLLQELTQDTIDPKVDITTVLRKARVLAARLMNPEFEAWIHHELNGYPDRALLPKYRILSIQAHAHLIIGWTQLPSAAVMPSQIPEEYRDWATTSYALQPVTELVSLIAGIASKSHDAIQSPWPQEPAIKFGGSGYGNGRDHVQCLKAWQDISPAEIVGIIETVRNKLLEFVLQIEKEAPGAGEAEPWQMPLPQEKVTQFFNTHIHGGVAHIGGKDSHGHSKTLQVGSMKDSQIQQADEGATQTATFARGSQEHSDLVRLVQTMSHGIGEMSLDQRARRKAETQIATIKAQLEDDEPDSGIVGQAGRTLRNVTEGAIGSLIASAIQPGLWQWVAHAMQMYFPK